ncbi:S49 family peptidase [Niveispirillum cyanobacteriorum]|uniref:Peptidase S49 n=1 Tax=Niveispirillum cyanobacteriorum TaxID=1612173 RepID=A0A2K9NI28_9PROT|nr:S49 family peptidase [Niveispirillum cyanobacteriorum]AUN31955.1 peptidase S49 [Niveispirillum cyanobacteriorum]GGE85447.1 hypothetical protein GCM10011317_48310 [Niveispirillum cyanobacteriorum]
MTTVFDALTAEPWAIQPDWLPRLAALAQRQGMEKDTAEAARVLREQTLAMAAGPSARRLEGARYAMVTAGGVAILPIFGPIFPRANLMTEMSGATSVAALQNDYRLALANADIGATLFLLDTPGGAVSGINAMADTIHAGRKHKPTVAFVAGAAASAGYWIASATSAIHMERTAMVGSIGVVAALPKQVEPGSDGSIAVEIVSSNAPNKRPDPTTEEGAATIRATLDAIEAQFIADVARGRATTPTRIKSDFGQGGVLVGRAAVEAGMADGIKSYDQVLAELTAQVSNKRRADALRK